MARRKEMTVGYEDVTGTPTIYMALDLGRRRWAAVAGLWGSCCLGTVDRVFTRLTAAMSRNCASGSRISGHSLTIRKRGS